MSDQLYHECHEIITQGKVILEDLQQWGFETVIPLPVEEVCLLYTSPSPRDS